MIEQLREGLRLVGNLRQACRDTGSPVVPTPVADALRELAAWQGECELILAVERPCVPIDDPPEPVYRPYGA